MHRKQPSLFCFAVPIHSLISLSLSKAVHLTFSLSKYCICGYKHASILLTHFMVSNSSLGMCCPKIVWVFWITWTFVSKFQPHNSRFNVENNQKWHGLSPGGTVDASLLQCCGAWATLAQEEPFVAEYCLDDESAIEEVLVISARYDQGVFPVPFSTSCAFEHWSYHIFFVHFLHVSFYGGVHTTVFTKPTVTWDLLDVQMSAGAR